MFSDFDEALAATKPELAVIATYTDSHADYACAAMEAGAHVFVEKPLAMNVADADPRGGNGARAPAASWSSATSCATTRPGCG